MEVEDQQGTKHPIQLPVTIVPGLGRLFSGGSAATKGVSVVIAARSYLDLGNFKVNLRTEENCSTLTYLDLAIHCSIKHRDGISLSDNIGTYSGAETVMPAKMAMVTSSAQVTDIKRKVSFFKELPAVLSTTTDSGGINTITNSHNRFIKSYVDSKNYEHIPDDTSSPESEDTKGDGIIHPKYPVISEYLFQRWTRTT